MDKKDIDLKILLTEYEQLSEDRRNLIRMSVLAITIYLAVIGYLIASVLSTFDPKSNIIITSVIIALNIFAYCYIYKFKKIEISMENSIEKISKKVSFIGNHKYDTRLFFNIMYWINSLITIGAILLALYSLLIISGITGNIFSLPPS